MAAIRGFFGPETLGVMTNTFASTDLNSHVEFDNVYAGSVVSHPAPTPKSHNRLASSNRWQISGQIAENFKGDLYHRINISPSIISLGTIGSTVLRDIYLWNAFTDESAQLTAINLNNGQGITVEGLTLPYTIPPLTETSVKMTVLSSGPPDIAAEVTFDFGNVTDPRPVAIFGNRAVLMGQVPESGLEETWEWLTDISVAADGTEQRVGLRATPRRSQRAEIMSTDLGAVNDQLRTLLNARGRLFIPYFQWAALITEDAAIGATVLKFDSIRCDVRAGDYVTLYTKDRTTLLQLDTVSATQATLKNPLTVAVVKGTVIAPTFASVLDNNTSVKRYNVDHVATSSLQTTVLTQRSVFERPGNTASLTMLDGMPVLTEQQMGEGDDSYGFQTGQEVLDAKTGLQTVENDWDFTKIARSLSFVVHRMESSGPAKMDYWRKFLAYARGSLNPFLVPTFRADQTIISTVGDGSDSLIFAGGTYADDYFPVPPFRWLAIFTDAGPHYCKVVGAAKDGDGNTSITFAPPLPTGVSWRTVQKVSYLIKSRISNDRVRFTHDSIDTTVSLNVRAIK